MAMLTFFLCIKRQRGVSTSNSINIKKSGKKKRDQKCEDSFVFTFPLVHFAPHARLSDIVDRVFDQVKAPSGMLNWICCSRSLSITLEKAVNGFPERSISSSEGGGHAGWHVLMVMPGFHSKAVLHAPLATEHSASDVPAASGQNGGGKALVRHSRRLHHKRNIGRRVMLPAFTLRALQSTPLERSEAIDLDRLVQLLPNDLGVHGHRLPQIHGQELQEVVDGGQHFEILQAAESEVAQKCKISTDPRRTARGGFAQRSWKNLCAQLSPSHKNIRVNRTGCSSLALKDICEWMGWKVLVLHWTCDPIHHSPSWFHCLHLLVATRTVSRGRS